MVDECCCFVLLVYCAGLLDGPCIVTILYCSAGQNC